MHAQLDAINDAFVEARDEIEYAQEVRMGPPLNIHVLYQKFCYHLPLNKPQVAHRCEAY